MNSLLLDEIKQRRPFANTGEAVFLNLVRTTEALARSETAMLKSHDLSFAQYNVLRILRGAGDDGLSCGEISARMVKHDPDVTRLLDRLVRRKLVSRVRAEHDRRVVLGRITDQGKGLLDEIDDPLSEVHRAQTAHMSEHDLQLLIGLLERLRTPPKE